MDGNGRWAAQRNLPRVVGHKKGAEALRGVIEGVIERDIPYLSVYAFSSENWCRPANEVKHILNLFQHYLEQEEENLFKHDIRLKVLGDKERLPASLRDCVTRLEDMSYKHTGLVLQVAFSYGGRAEIVEAVREIIQEIQKDKLSLIDVDEKLISRFLQTSDVPDPDLLIRTSGEQRISNYMLWQMAYTEMMFPKVHWPDFTVKHLDEAIEAYKKRDRRFGRIKTAPPMHEFPLDPPVYAF